MRLRSGCMPSMPSLTGVEISVVVVMRRVSVVLGNSSSAGEPARVALLEEEVDSFRSGLTLVSGFMVFVAFVAFFCFLVFSAFLGGGASLSESELLELSLSLSPLLLELSESELSLSLSDSELASELSSEEDDSPSESASSSSELLDSLDLEESLESLSDELSSLGVEDLFRFLLTGASFPLSELESEDESDSEGEGAVLRFLVALEFAATGGFCFCHSVYRVARSGGEGLVLSAALGAMPFFFASLDS